MKKISLFLVLSLLVTAFTSKAQVAVTPNNIATDLAQMLLGTGVTLSNATLDCGAGGSGLFLTTASNLGLDSGIVLTSGSATASVGTVASYASSSTNNGSDPDLLTLVGNGSIHDKCILEFDFVTVGDTVKFEYVFGSEEYLGYTCSAYNDVFGFFLSGPGIVGPYTNSATNIALVPGSTTCPVAISTIYCPNLPGCVNAASYCFGNTPGCGAFNAANNTCAYFVCNGSTTPGTVAYQGFTTVLTATSPVIPCSTYHIKLAIADKNDGILDSGVFLKAKSFSSNIISYKIETGLSADNPYIIEGCDSAKLTIKRKIILNTPVADTVNFLISGTAQNGIDYLTIPNQVSFAANMNDTIQSFIYLLIKMV